ncbi:MAG TPA: flagellar basal-body MS-ring/collar protein FliF [Verrucomicrobiae bacterium]|nr:flagellar basal-body MS-ring/collar protein FliF [Verrucomicrobiae bacterium]
MNQNLSKLGKQLMDIWGQLGASQRVSVLAATFVLVAGLVAAAMWSSHADYGLLYGGLSDTESAKVVAALDDAKVPYKAGSGGAIMVPADKVYTMRMQLASKGIPQGDGVGFEIFDKPNFGISDFVQRANYLRALQGELSRTIGQLDEVSAARVMIVVPENRLLLDKDKFPTASVFVKVRGSSPLSPQTINSIRFLVANSVEGLKTSHVAVVDNLGNTEEMSDSDSMAGVSSSQLAARRALEQYLGKKAQDMLETVLGPGQAMVRVSADVNYDTMTKSEKKFDPDGQVVRSQTKKDDDNDTSAAQNTTPTGISGNTINETNGAQASATPVNSSKNHQTTSTIEYEIGETTSDTTMAAGGIKRLTAAVTVAQQMQGTGADRKPVARTPEELDKLRLIVTSALGADTTRGDTIELAELPFNDQFATDMNQQLDQQVKHDFWMDLAHKSFYPALGLVAFFILLRAFKQTPVQDIPIGVPVGRLAYTNGNGNGNGHSRTGNYTVEPQPGVVTVDVLNRLIKDNPNNMTHAIREWMNRGHTPNPES